VGDAVLRGGSNRKPAGGKRPPFGLFFPGKPLEQQRVPDVEVAPVTGGRAGTPPAPDVATRFRFTAFSASWADLGTLQTGGRLTCTKFGFLGPARGGGGGGHLPQVARLGAFERGLKKQPGRVRSEGVRGRFGRGTSFRGFLQSNFAGNAGDGPRTFLRA